MVAGGCGKGIGAEVNPWSKSFARNRLVLLTADPKHPLYASWIDLVKIPWEGV